MNLTTFRPVAAARGLFSVSLLLAASALLTGCASVQVEEYAGRAPALDPRTFFDGTICADGVVRDRSGKQIRQFNARILASWEDQGNGSETGTLDEVFYFYDEPGAEAVEETRVWTLTPNGSGGYHASATDVPQPTTMKHAGNSIQMAYTLRYGKPGDTLDLDMDDWMFQVADGVVINETRMSKWGIHVGQVLLVMRKVPAGYECLPARKG
ncbi:DUF3833 domain-containing protein [Thalassolituus pacificus]|uniref:DUF3833 domain-containing protein n=1 Tax=Thalassolituus pacificus TaxID=2975440 RepID=A0A9X2WIP8_9GAMM|nr:DUF3833 domain-containing protein [Thalassolituus pacificus]MCT7360953.1 DUF3833 domain-containing protein [Thalassolituus pacificus]